VPLIGELAGTHGDSCGSWSSVWKRFRRWSRKDVFERIFQALAQNPDFEYALIDGTIVKVHRHGTGAKGGPKTRPPPSRLAAARCYRPWRRAKLQVLRRRPRKRIATDRPRPQAPAGANQVWSYDFVFDWCANAQQLSA
jgi:hypothetical protein